MTTIVQTPATTAGPSIKARQQAMWASGDFAVIGTMLQIVGEVLCETIDRGGATGLVVPAEYLETIITR